MNPEQSQNDSVLSRSRQYAEYCTMAYQMYANRVQYLYDPFYARHRDVNQVQDMLRGQAQVLKQPNQRELDFISYEDSYSNVDPRQPTFYAGNTYFEPPEFAGKIGRIFNGDELVREYSDRSGQDDSIDVYIFHGTTGEGGEHGGFPSTMGYVAYNRKTKEITVTFRGSRSGSAVRGGVGGLFLDSGNPDWVTDMNLAGDLVENPELLVGGKVAEGFATTYLSCRSELIGIIKKIRESDPEPEQPPKLVTTGHSLGGALASMMFIDAQKGTLGTRLSSVLGGETKDEVFVNDLLQGAECFAFSTPPVCDGRAVENIGDQTDKYHRVFFANDPIVYGGNILRMLRGRGLFEHKELLRNIDSHSDVDLGKFTAGSPFDPHELYLVYEQIQRNLGVRDEDIRRHWFKIRDMMITHASRDVEPIPLNAEQAAVIFNQFDYEYFLTLARLMAEGEAHDSNTDLIKYIEEIGLMFRDINPYESQEKFDEFKQKLAEITARLTGAISNEERSWKKYPRKASEFMLQLLKVVLMALNIVLEFCKGLANWLKVKMKHNPDETQYKELSASIQALNDCCSNLINNVVVPFSEQLGAVNSTEELQKYMDSLSKGLNEIQEKMEVFQKCNEHSGNLEDSEITKFSEQLVINLKRCIEVCNSVIQDPAKYSEYQDDLETGIYRLIETFADFEAKVVKRQGRWSMVSYNPSFAERMANVFMMGSGLTFGLKVGLAKFVGSLRDLGYAAYNLFVPANATKNYMRDILGNLSRALEKTSYDALKTARDRRANPDVEVIPKGAEVIPA
ncbi:MAG: lipase family protein [Coxiellaceae bacterium]|jgi:hypothetical protein|nr:lipase family protein [Coxiellaceae bacterium]